MHSLDQRPKNTKNLKKKKKTKKRRICHSGIIIDHMKLKPIRFPALYLRLKISKTWLVYFYGFQREKKKKRRSKLPLLCVFGLVDQPVADEHDAGLQYKEINPLIQNQPGLITESVISCPLLRGRSLIWARIVMSLNKLKRSRADSEDRVVI